MQQFEFDPKHLVPLITFIHKRNEAIGIPSPRIGFLNEMIEFYLGYLEDRKYYEGVLDFYKKGALGKIQRIHDLVEEAKKEPLLIRKKQLLLEAIETRKQLNLFYPLD